MTSIAIPAGVTVIGNTTFGGCNRLTSVTIPKGVTKIRGYAFLDCSSLRDVTIPEDVKEIEYGAFARCTGLSSLTIPDGALVWYNAFEGCTGLRNVTLPEDGKIGSYAFRNCTSLTNVTIPKGANIANQAFANCTSLAKVTILDGVTEIDRSAFDHCASLKTVKVYSRTVSFISESFKYPSYASPNLTVYGHAGSATESDCKKNEIPFLPLTACPGTAKAGTLTGSDGQSVSWAITETGKLSVTGDLAPKEAVLVGCYDNDGRFLGVKWLTAQHAAAQIDPDTPNVKLFWLGANQNPLSPSATVWGK